MNTGATWAAATVSGLGISNPLSQPDKMFLVFCQGNRQRPVFWKQTPKLLDVREYRGVAGASCKWAHKTLHLGALAQSLLDARKPAPYA
jgi:hypothetical protein